MSIVDELLANPGLYVGIDRLEGTDHTGTARILVTPLPGGAGVSLDYEVLSPSVPERPLSHVEHTMIGRAGGGGAVMVIGHTHGESLAVLRETDPGVFELGHEPSPYPMKVVVSVPAPGRIRHAWWYGMPGEDLAERDVAEVTLQT
jgi:hypothetical protein